MTSEHSLVYNLLYTILPLLKYKTLMFNKNSVGKQDCTLAGCKINPEIN